MTKLNSNQRELLSQAANAADGVMAAPGTSKATSAALIRRGFFISIPAADGPSRLHITDAGRAAIGMVADAPPATSEPAAPVQKGKVGAMIELLRRREGATVEALMVVTGWQAHSVRGAISGAIKKVRGLPVASEVADGKRIYRIVAGAGA